MTYSDQPTQILKRSKKFTPAAPWDDAQKLIFDNFEGPKSKIFRFSRLFDKLKKAETLELMTER